jgi:cytidine deaminase
MTLDHALVDAARDLLVRRFGDHGWGGAAALRTSSGRVLTSVSVEALLDAANLCIETGAIAEAHKWDEPVTASVCLVRPEGGEPQVVTACGHCQERLRFWGPEVEVAVPAPGEPGWQARTLAELQPFWWGTRFGAR